MELQRGGHEMKLSTKGRYAMVALADLAMAEAKAGAFDLVLSLIHISEPTRPY